MNATQFLNKYKHQITQPQVQQLHDLIAFENRMCEVVGNTQWERIQITEYVNCMDSLWMDCRVCEALDLINDIGEFIKVIDTELLTEDEIRDYEQMRLSDELSYDY